MSETPQAPRAVWRRVAPPKAPPQPTDGVPDFFSADLDKLRRCGEAGISDSEFMKSVRDADAEEARRAEAYWAEQERRRAEEAEAEKQEKKRRAEEDDVKAAERYRNDRYAVRLLRQENNAWGGNDADSGMIG